LVTLKMSERETLLSFLDDCRSFGNETAMVHWCGLRLVRWSYALLAETAYQFAHELAARNISKGDRVLFWSENNPAWIAAFYGCLLHGVIVVPLDRQSTTEFITRAKYALVVSLFNVFPLPQETGFRRSFAFAGETVDRGYSLLVFPEGRRTEDGQLNPFMAGIGLLVQKLNVPVVPVRIDGLFALKQQGRRRARPGEIGITFGAPVRFARDESAAQITRALQASVEEIAQRKVTQ
jgi:hypothetical protein